MRAIRGAITVDDNTAGAIESAVAELIRAIAESNRIAARDIVSAIFTLTPDLDADFPARAARACGWEDVAMLCAREIPVPGALARVCRVLVHARGEEPARHVYLRAARVLRPDLHNAPRSDAKEEMPP